MTDTELFATSASAAVENAARLGLTWRILTATIIDGTTTMNVLVTIDGDVESQLTRAISLIGPLSDGERVTVLVTPPQGVYIIGTYGPRISPLSYIDEITRITAVTGITTTETQLDAITFESRGPDVRYKITWVGTVQSTVANDSIRLKGRWVVNFGPLSAADTQFTSRDVNADVAGRGQVFTLVKTVTGIPAGLTTIGVTAVRSGGTGTIQSFADASREVSLLLEYA